MLLSREATSPHRRKHAIDGKAYHREWRRGGGERVPDVATHSQCPRATDAEPRKLLASFVGNAPVLPNLERGKDRYGAAKYPMPISEMILMRIVENERRDDEPSPTDQLSEFLPFAKDDNFQLGKREHRKTSQCGVENDNGHNGLIVKPRRKADSDAKPQANAVFPRTVRLEKTSDVHGIFPR
jgi:hypothetical protein